MATDLQGRIDAVGKAITETPAPQAQTKDAAAGGGQSGGGEGSDPAALASQIGNTGAILLPGQAAIFGGQRVSLASLSAETNGASIAVGDNEAKDVKSGGAVDVSDSCKVTLAGVAAGAAYFSAGDCQDTAAAGGNEQAASAGGEGGKAAAPASAPQQQAAAGGASGAGAATAASGGAKAEAPSGAGEQPAAQPEQQAAAGGAEGAAKPAEGGAAAAAATSGSGSDQKAAPAGGSGEAQPAAEASNATEATVPVGAAAMLGSKRIFVSAIGENNASLFVAGDFSAGAQTRQTVEVGKAMDAGDGCMVTLASIDAGQAKLTSEGCVAGGSNEQAAAKPEAAPDQQAAAPSGDGDKTASDSAPTAPAKSGSDASGTPKATAPAAAAGSSASGGSTTEATVPVGGTAALGDKRIFVSAIGEDNASLFVAGGFSAGAQTRETVEVGKAMDAGDGCMVTLASIDAGQAKLTSEGCAGGAAAKPADASGSSDQAASDEKKAEAPATGGEQQAAAAAPAPAPAPASGASTSTGGEQKPAASGDKQAAAGGNALSVGQTGTYGEHKVFVSSLGDGRQRSTSSARAAKTSRRAPRSISAAAAA